MFESVPVFDWLLQVLFRWKVVPEEGETTAVGGAIVVECRVGEKWTGQPTSFSVYNTHSHHTPPPVMTQEL